MSVIKSMRRQRAVYWASTGTDHYGNRSYADPVEIRCRWDDGSNEIRGVQGESLQFTATVYVDREMSIGDKLRKGELESGDPTDPSEDPDAKEIQRFNQTPNFRATETLYTAYL